MYVLSLMGWQSARCTTRPSTASLMLRPAARSSSEGGAVLNTASAWLLGVDTTILCSEGIFWLVLGTFFPIGMGPLSLTLLVSVAAEVTSEPTLARVTSSARLRLTVGRRFLCRVMVRLATGAPPGQFSQRSAT